MPDNLYELFQIIYIARNPKDVAVSLYYFTLSFKPITRYDGKFEDFCNLFVEDKGKVSFIEVNADSLAKLLIIKLSLFSYPLIKEGGQWHSCRVLDQGAAGSNLTGVTALCPLAITLILA